MTKIQFGEDIEAAKPAFFDLETLIDTRLLIQANSGGGKSYLIRKLLEVSHGKVQQIVLDLEGEFGTLREKFDYILAGKGGDIPASPRTAEVLARKVLELGTSIIIDLYELNHMDRKRFVRIFLETLINAPKELWHPCLVVVDEAHVFVPEKGESEASGAVIDLMTRGRKRGFCGVLATQRLSKLHKDAAAECNNKLIGRTGLDVDMKRGAEELGFTSKVQELSLRELDPGVFYSFGPALSRIITKIKVGEVETTHPKAGARIVSASPPPPREKIRAILSRITDLPQVAEREQRDKEAVEKENRELRLTVRRLQTQSESINPEKLAQIQSDAIAKGRRLAESESSLKLRTLEADAQRLRRALVSIAQVSAEAAGKESPKFEERKTQPNQSAVLVPYLPPPRAPARIAQETLEPMNGESDEKPLRAGAMRMLRAAAQFYPSPITKSQMATLSHVSIGGGSFGTYFGELRAKGWITERDDSAELTQDGLSVAGNVPPLPTDSDQLVEMWCGNFRAGVGRMLRVLARNYPSPVEREALGEESQVSVAGGSFDTYLGELVRNGLAIKEGDQVKASPTLFMEPLTA